MKITPTLEAYFRNRLPIDKDEVIIAIYRRHPVAYVIPLLIALFVIAIIGGLSYVLTSGPTASVLITETSHELIIAGVGVFSFLVLMFAYIPIWMSMQDRVILTNESVMQILQTSPFSDKVSQLSLQHVADVTVRAGFWGNMLGFGTLTIETPGEQSNYQFSYLPDGNEAARQIAEAHENFIAALESGQLHSNPMYPRHNPNAAWPPAPTITVDPAEYQKFLEYQKQQNGQKPPQPEQ